MKTVAAPIYFSLLQSTNTTIPTPIKILKKETNLEEELLAGDTVVGRTEHHEDCGRPNLFLSFTKYKYHNTNANKN